MRPVLGLACEVGDRLTGEAPMCSLALLVLGITTCRPLTQTGQRPLINLRGLPTLPSIADSSPSQYAFSMRAMQHGGCCWFCVVGDWQERANGISSPVGWK